MRLLGFTPYIVMSGSMEPIVHTGAVAFINTHDTDVGIGDIVTYRIGTQTTIRTGISGEIVADEGKLVTHRIIAMEGIDFVTKGDANATEDLMYVKQSQIVGKYMFQIPALGYLLEKGGRKLFLQMALAIALLNITSTILSDAEEEEEKEKEEQVMACFSAVCGGKYSYGKARRIFNSNPEYFYKKVEQENKQIEACYKAVKSGEYSLGKARRQYTKDPTYFVRKSEKPSFWSKLFHKKETQATDLPQTDVPETELQKTELPTTELPKAT